jgi:hypothetical protein
MNLNMITNETSYSSVATLSSAQLQSARVLPAYSPTIIGPVRATSEAVEPLFGRHAERVRQGHAWEYRE